MNTRRHCAARRFSIVIVRIINARRRVCTQGVSREIITHAVRSTRSFTLDLKHQYDIVTTKRKLSDFVISLGFHKT